LWWVSYPQTKLWRIGRSAPRHYSIMGYLLDPEEVLCQTVPAIIRNLK